MQKAPYFYLSFSLTLALITGLSLTSCTNYNLKDLKSKSASNSSTTDSNASSSSTYRYKISNVQLTGASSGGSSGASSGTGGSYNATVFIDQANAPQSSTGAPLDFRTVCTDSEGTTKPCVCQFVWNEVNDTGATAVTLVRKIQTPVTTAQAWAVTCAAPSVYSAEIPDGTQLKISVLPGSSSVSSFSTNVYNYTKSASSGGGAFTSTSGATFENIMRYACYETFKRGSKIANAQAQITRSDGTNQGETGYAISTTNFCFRKADGTKTSGQGCEESRVSVGDLEFSAQSSYHNLYVRSNQSGEINYSNARFTCPLVKESLALTVSPGSGSQTGAGGSYWPLDTSFALSRNKTTDFAVGVDGFSVLSGSGAQDSSCAAEAAGSATGSSGGDGAAAATDGGSSSSSSSTSSGSKVRRCLGWASKPNSDGTCPIIRDSNGIIRPTYRLRRFITVYPPFYDTDGALASSGQSSDFVYVTDRPVNRAGQDPTRPYTMRGPKPCPFAYFDRKGVTVHDPLNPDPDYPSGKPGYVATNNPLWSNLNPDGLEFPNLDVGQSCSATMPLFNVDTRIGSLATVHPKNPIYKRIHVRPARAWSPHYEEDTDFMACAPQPGGGVIDPPLHFAKDPSTGNVAYCAEAYPSQNQALQDLEVRNNSTNYPGKVAPFTSHVIKNSSSTTCAASTLTAKIAADPGLASPIYPNLTEAGTNCPGNLATPYAAIAGMAHHPQYIAVDEACYPTGTTSPYGGNSVNNIACTNATGHAGIKNYWCTRKTCDRTVVTPSNIGSSSSFNRFPVLARPSQVEAALINDSTYQCTVSWDNSSGKAGKQSPTEGCCGANVHVWSGSNTTAPTNGSSQSAKYKFNFAAHLEPDKPCLAPTY